MIVGGAGADRIDGGRGFDLICAGHGSDVVLGENGGDTVFGGTGDDRLYGGLQDDKLSGDDGADLLIGGPAGNTLLGGSGNDFVRDGLDVDGGPGLDWISFADRPDRVSITLPGLNNSRRRGLESLVGSRFADFLWAGDQGLPGTVRGLGFPTNARDQHTLPLGEPCVGFAVNDCPGPWGRDDQTTVLIDPWPFDPGVTVIGGPANDRLSISRTDGRLRVESGGSLESGDGCAGDGTRVVSCQVPGQLGYLLAYGGDGDDSITVEGSLGATTTVNVDGGAGSDIIRGGPGDEDLNAGLEAIAPGPFEGYPPYLPSNDTVFGGGGDDALTAGFKGTDRLYGGAGSDQLATRYVCGGGSFAGGPGRGDIADFALGSEVKAHLGRYAISRGAVHGSPCDPTYLGKDIELLEGSRGPDLLIGDGRSNPLIVGHQGNDTIRGLGGADRLVGEAGFDRLFGGGGADTLDCGEDGGAARRGHGDHTHGCR